MTNVVNEAAISVPPSELGHAIPDKPSTVAKLERFAALDVLRGLAILGTLATNISIFLIATKEGPEWAVFLDTALGLVTDGKWIGLLTIMFGIGLEIQRQAAVRRGDPWLGTYPWRAVILILDGLLNYIFIFEHDVLMGYGITALIVAVVLATTPKVQAWVLGLSLTAHVAYLIYLENGDLSIFNKQEQSDSLPEEQQLLADLSMKNPQELTSEELKLVADNYGLTTKQYVESWESGFDLDRGSEVIGFGDDAAGDMVGMTAPDYLGQVQSRVENFVGGRLEIPIMIVMGLGLFLVGAFLFRAGLFAESGRKLRLWVMGLSFGIGMPIDFVTRLWFADSTGTYNRYLTSTFVSFGILALVAHFYAKGRDLGLIGKPIALVGRMALTCYVGQNLIASILFYKWGFDLSGYLPGGFFGTIVAWAAISAILIVFSAVWLRFFSRGPLEWLWHVSYLWLVKNTTMRFRARREIKAQSA